MKKYVIRRFLSAILVLWGVSLVVFCLAVLLPGDFVRAACSGNRVSASFADSLRTIYGFDQPLLIRYYSWLSHAIRGDFGQSLSLRQPVLSVIFSYLPVTLLVSIPAFFLELTLGILGGTISALYHRRTLDHVILLVSLLLLCLPPFFLALLLQKWFAIDLGLLPLSGFSTAGQAQTLGNITRHLLLPWITLALLDTGRLLRYTRSSVLQTLSLPFVQTLRANGLAPSRVLRDVLRGALIPIITYIGLSIPVLFSGALVIETLFGIPGLGTLSYRAIMTRDYPLIMGLVMLLAFTTIVCNFLTDMLYVAADSRLRGGTFDT